MIIIKLKGGLGNQLFQYAYGRLLSLHYGVQVKYEFSGKIGDIPRDYKLGYFNTYLQFPTKEEVQKTKYPYGVFSKISRDIKEKIFRQHYIGYVPSALHKTSGYFEGYWQSYKYLEPIKKKLLREVTLKEDIEVKFPDIIKQMTDTNSVSVHIRRGDYVSNPKTKAEHYTFGMEYYDAAVKLMEDKVPNPTLFIFSDDIAWVKENFKTDVPMVFVSEPNMPDYENFMIATYCKHHIIANSTFSFWIAWLDQKPDTVVIAPKKWNNRYQNKYKDLLPKDWITI